MRRVVHWPLARIPVMKGSVDKAIEQGTKSQKAIGIDVEILFLALPGKSALFSSRPLNLLEIWLTAATNNVVTDSISFLYATLWKEMVRVLVVEQNFKCILLF